MRGTSDLPRRTVAVTARSQSRFARPHLRHPDTSPGTGYDADLARELLASTYKRISALAGEGGVSCQARRHATAVPRDGGLIITRPGRGTFPPTRPPEAPPMLTNPYPPTPRPPADTLSRIETGNAAARPGCLTGL